jgi:penicillin-binding protein 1C
LFPPNGAALALQSSGAAIDPIAIKIAGGTAPLNILVDGMPLQSVRGAGTVFFAPVGPGFVRLTVTDALGAADSVTVRLQP